MAFRLRGTQVLVRRNIDGIQMVMPYFSFDQIRESIEQKDQTPIRKLSLLGECDQDGNLIDGNPHIHEHDVKDIGKDPSQVKFQEFAYQA